MGSHSVEGTQGEGTWETVCPEDKGLWGGLGLARGKRQVSVKLGASHCGLFVMEFQAQRLYKSH